MFYRKVYRFHQAQTVRGSVTGVHIDMLTPEAFWTVIGVAVTLDGSPTLCTGEVFNVTLEFFVHWLVSAFFERVGLMSVLDSERQQRHVPNSNGL